MSDEWEMLAISDVTSLASGKNAPQSVRTTHGDFRLMGANGQIGYVTTPLHEGPVITVGRVGACGEVHRIPAGERCWISDNALIAKGGDRVTHDFLGLLLESVDYDSIRTGTTQPLITQTALKQIEVPVPPIVVQRRIVDLVSAVDTHITNLEAEAEALDGATRTLREESFAGLVGMPSTRADVMFEMLLGRQKSAKQSVGDHVIPYLRAANISADGLKLDDVQTMNFDPAEQRKYGLREDDILLVEGGTIGQAARWNAEIAGPLGFDKHLIRLRGRAGKSTSEFALQWAHWCRESGAFDDVATGMTIRALGFARASAMPVPDLSVESQIGLTAPLAAADRTGTMLRDEAAACMSFRTQLLQSLLSREVEIPESYDEVLAGVG